MSSQVWTLYGSHTCEVTTIERHITFWGRYGSLPKVYVNGKLVKELNTFLLLLTCLTYYLNFTEGQIYSTQRPAYVSIGYLKILHKDHY